MQCISNDLHPTEVFSVILTLYGFKKFWCFFILKFERLSKSLDKSQRPLSFLWIFKVHKEFEDHWDLSNLKILIDPNGCQIRNPVIVKRWKQVRDWNHYFK